MAGRPYRTQYTTSLNTFEQGELLEREGTAELENDPRFFTENVIDKRLAAFEAIAIVTELMSTSAMSQVMEVAKEFAWTGEWLWVAVIQLLGFFSMMSVMFMSTLATAVLSLQLFFTVRLMTAGPTGFDKAARFYQDNRMWVWRERAIFSVKWSLVFYFLSTGFMAYVKFFTEGAPEIERESKRLRAQEFSLHQTLASVVFVMFMIGSLCVAQLMRVHQRCFDESYSSLDSCHNELNRHLVPSHRDSHR